MAKKKACECEKQENTLNIQPLGDRIVVERDTAEAVTSGGIYLPETTKNKPSRGTVLAVGDGRLMKDGTRLPLQLSVGDHVFFVSYAPEEFKVNGKEVLLMREEDVIAVIG